MHTDIATGNEQDSGNAELPLRDRLYKIIFDRQPITSEADLFARLVRNETTQTLVAAVSQLGGSQDILELGAGAYKLRAVVWQAQNNPDELSLTFESEYSPGTGYGHNYRFSLPMHPDFSLDGERGPLDAHSTRFDHGSTARDYVRGHDSSDPAITWELTQSAAGELISEIDRLAK